MNLSKKLLLTAFIPMLIILLSGGFAVWQTHGMLENFAIVNDTYDANARAALEMQVDFNEQIHQWKNVLLRGDNPDDLRKHWSDFLRLEKEIDTDAALLITRLGKSEAAPMIQNFLEMHKQLGNAYRASLDVFQQSRYDSRQADSLIRGADNKLSEDLGRAVDLITEESTAFSSKTKEEAWRTARFNFLSMLLTLLITTTLFFVSLKKHVLSPIGLLSNFARRLSAGEHDQHIDFKSNDELGTLTATFNHASKKIASLISHLETSKTRYHDLIEGVDAIILELNPLTNKYTFVSQRAEALLGYPLSRWHDEPGFLEKYCHPDDFPACQEKISEALKSGVSGEYTCRAITADGNIVWINNRIRLIKDEQSKEISLLGVMVDITQMKQYEDRMAYLSSHDELTGLANRNLLVDRLERAIAHAKGAREAATAMLNKSPTQKLRALHAKEAENMTALLLVNIDRFKLINESLGHRLGDEVIKSVAQRLQGVIGTDDTLARLGADEFAIVLRDISKPEDVAETAREILRRVAQPLEIEQNSLVTNCSIGISMYPKDGENGSDLLKNAGSALTRVKQQQKNNFKFYTEEMNAMALASLQLENKMRNAIENREFVLHYQPQVSISDNRLTGVEALIRWAPPGEPMVPPMSFIPLAEETKLILPMGEWIIREACRQNKEWQDKGFAPFCVAVNISASQFSQPGIIELVARTLEETGLEPRYLELEITESVMMNDVNLVIKNLEKLHELGVKLAIDDFGTGYSSLSYLKHLPIDKLKVDRSFVQDISVDSDDEAIVDTIVAMAHNLKIGVIAEGVETEAQLQYLRDRQCEEVQGYFYSKPLTPALLEDYLASGGPSARGAL
ncbi:MAG TPA: EAL domain-containing protein [Gallionella sp.]|nr:EAL domain-containing protein [Gallionella sp.]